MFPANSHTNDLSTSPRIRAMPATHRLAVRGSRFNGEPHSGHVVNGILVLDHPVTPDEHSKHLDQVSPSHILYHIGFVRKKEVYSSNHSSPRYAMLESFTASFPHDSVETHNRPMQHAVWARRVEVRSAFAQPFLRAAESILSETS
jgi:hypothetical protein